jgi:LSD1 subclass zinc finger protein
MIVAQAPLQLPFAPKPFRRELFSSWLLRLAAANCVTLEELLAGLQASYPLAPYALSLDVNLDDGFLRFIVRFSRVPPRRLGPLSLEKQVSNPEAALLLRFNNNSSGSRLLNRRLGYAFCPYCVAHQSFVHVPWEWVFACLAHCSVHGTQLEVGCPSCGDLDPLPFGLIPGADHVRCQCCGANLLDDPTHKGRRPCSRTVLEFEKDYRAALLGAAPDLTLLQGASSAQFRQFVDDTLRLVANFLDERPFALYGKLQPSPGSSRQELIRTILQLVLNASTDCDMYERRARYRNSLKVWEPLLVPLTPEGRRNLARISRAWPASLQRSLASALAQITRRDSFYVTAAPIHSVRELNTNTL